MDTSTTTIATAVPVPQEPPEGATPETTEKVTQSAEDLQKQIDDLARHAKNKEEEAARVQKKLERLEKEDADRKKAELSEVERLKVEKQEAETKAENAKKELANERAKNKAISEAGKLQFGDKKQRFFNAEIAYKLLTDEEKSGDVLEALTKLAKENPLLLEQPAAPGDGVGTGKKGTKSNEQVAVKYPKSRY